MRNSDLVLLVFVLLAVVCLISFVLVLRHGRRRGAPPAALVAGNLLLLAGLLAVLATIGEIYYRFLYDRTDAYHVSLTSARWIERHYRYNNLRVRDDVDYRLARTAGRPRLTILGDSFANGHGVTDVDDRFANILRRERPGWEVHCLAEDGLDTGAIVERLRGLLDSGYQLEDVLYAYTLNDISDLIPEWKRAADRLYGDRPPYLVRHSFLVNTHYYRLRIARDPELAAYFDWISASYDGETWERHAARLRELVELVRGAGGRILVGTFPFLESRSDDRFLAIHARLAELWSAMDVPHLAMLDVYAGMSTAALIVNRHDSHPNENAHRLAAGALSDFLERELRREGSP